MSLIIDAAAEELAHGVARTAEPQVAVSVIRSFAEAEPVWRALERDTRHSGYQLFDWQERFHHHLGGGDVACLAVLADGAGRPLALLPLAISSRRGLGVARFIGGKHVNFAMGLWRPAFAGAMTAGAMRRALGDIAAQAPARIDLFRFANQPEAWAGMANPFRLLPYQPSPSFGYHLALATDGDAVLERVVSGDSRRKLRKKEKKLAERGVVAFETASTRDAIERFADTFLSFKAARFRELGIANVFAEPGMRDFIVETACRSLGQAEPALELCALTVGGDPVALFGGTIAQGRYSGMFNAMAAGAVTRESPGELLLHHLIRHCCSRGLQVFDLGAGEAQYKSNLCDGTDPLFDQFIAVTLRGRAAAAAFGGLAQAKRRIKQSELLWPLVVKLRRARGQAGA